KNRSAYKKFGLRKNIFSSISYKDLKDLPGEKPWLDTQSLKNIATTHDDFKKLPATIQDSIINWSENGYAILPSLFAENEVGQINEEIETLLNKGTVQWQYNKRKVMFAYRHSELIRNILDKPELNQTLRFLLGKPVDLFSSINFYKGSEQLPHSDSIHMSTHPEGYLIAIWIALEDIEEGSGPLTYYPGSHKLPYIHCGDIGAEGGFLKMDSAPYNKYEERIEELLAKEELKSETFLPRKGDVLIWHANLLHGGSPVTNPDRTRKSMVLHYYAQDVICYHEISQRPTLWP
ncbi:MAG TPA: phytanoyl-CoA dioxygenase, partial [Cryomorphaceae bacterium]|nr:phytanoyl-CoA dioxygenase [Cryomorphaceae bacterium]